MLRFLIRLWCWFKSWFVRNRPVAPPAAVPPARSPLSDLEYENGLIALLEEAEQGKSWGNLQGFLISRNLSPVQLAQWLKVQGSCWMEQAEQHPDLARRLLILGRVASGELATVVHAIGTQLQVSAVLPLSSEGSALVPVTPRAEGTGSDENAKTVRKCGNRRSHSTKQATTNVRSPALSKPSNISRTTP